MEELRRQIGRAVTREDCVQDELLCVPKGNPKGKESCVYQGPSVHWDQVESSNKVGSKLQEGVHADRDSGCSNDHFDKGAKRLRSPESGEFYYACDHPADFGCYVGEPHKGGILRRCAEILERCKEELSRLRREAYPTKDTVNCQGDEAWQVLIRFSCKCQRCGNNYMDSRFRGLLSEAGRSQIRGRAIPCRKCGSTNTGINSVLYQCIPPCWICDVPSKAVYKDIHPRRNDGSLQIVRFNFSENSCRKGSGSSRGSPVMQGHCESSRSENDEAGGSEDSGSDLSGEESEEDLDKFLESGSEVKIAHAGVVKEGDMMRASAASRSQLIDIVVSKEFANKGIVTSPPIEMDVQTDNGLTIAVGRAATSQISFGCRNDSAAMAKDDVKWAMLEYCEGGLKYKRVNGKWAAAWKSGDVYNCLFSKTTAKMVFERKVQMRAMHAEKEFFAQSLSEDAAKSIPSGGVKMFTLD